MAFKWHFKIRFKEGSGLPIYDSSKTREPYDTKANAEKMGEGKAKRYQRELERNHDIDAEFEAVAYRVKVGISILIVSASIYLLT